MSNRYSEIEMRMKDAVHQEDGFVPLTDTETRIALVRPRIGRKAIMLRQRHKEKMENRVFTIVYMVFVVFAVLLVMNYFFKGSSDVLRSITVCTGIVSVLLLCCIPLLITFKENIIERRTY